MNKFIAGLSMALALSACTGGMGDKSKAEAAINEGLQKSPSCDSVPIEKAAKQDVIDRSIALPELIAAGYVTKGQVRDVNAFGNSPKVVEGYVLTEKGQSLVVRPGNPYEFPCLRNGVWKVHTIEAIDNAVDASGKNVANVRATIRFAAEDWAEGARTNTQPAWERFWSGVKKMESKQWMYQLVRSGDALFFTGKGKPID